MTAGAEERLGEVLVTAPRERDGTPSPGDPTAFATVIDTRSAPTTVETLADALADAVGVQVRRFGGLGRLHHRVGARVLAAPGAGLPRRRAARARRQRDRRPERPAARRGGARRGVSRRDAAALRAGGAGRRDQRGHAPAGRAPVTAASASYGSFDHAQGRRHAQRRRTAPGTTCVFGHYLGHQGRLPVPRRQRHAGEPGRRPRASPASTTTSTWAASPRGVGWRPYDGVTLALTSDTFGRDRGFPGRGVPQDADARRQTVRHLSRLDADLPPRPGLPLSLEGSAWTSSTSGSSSTTRSGPVIQLTSDVEDRSLVGRRPGPRARARSARTRCRASSWR